MAVTLSSSNVAVNARSGTVVGTFNTNGLQLKSDPFGWFVIVGTQLCTTWNGQAMLGPQVVQVSAPDGTLTSFTITITAAAVAVPVQVTMSPATLSLSDTAAINTKLSTATVQMSDGSVYAGALTVAPTGMITASGMDLRLSRALTTADDGAHNCTVTAGPVTVPFVLTVTSVVGGISPDGTVSAPPSGPALVTTAGTWTWSSAAPGRVGEYNINLNGAPAPGIGSLMQVADKGQLYVNTAASGWYVWNNGFNPSPGPGVGPPVPKSVTLTPPSVTLPDNSPVNTLVSKAVVTMSDGSAYTGALTVVPTGMVVSSGSSLVLSRALTTADDGVRNFTVTAVTAGPVSATLALTVTAPTAPKPIIEVNPTTPQIPDTTSKGAVVATFTVTMSDGSPFIGKVSFGAPNFDSGGIFALSGNSIIVSPTGPGVGPNLGTITDHITLVAVQP